MWHTKSSPQKFTAGLDAMLYASSFQYFDAAAETIFTKANLPHWEQNGATYFITYRTADPIAKESHVLMLRLRNDFIQRFGDDPAESNNANGMSPYIDVTRRAFARRFATIAEKSLDELLGSCVLRDSQARNIVHDSLLHFTNEKY